MKPKVLRGIQVVLAMSCLLLAHAALSQDSQPAGTARRVELKDGRVLQGVVQRTATGYEIRTARGTVQVKADEVKSIASPDSGVQAYQVKRRAADQTKPEALYDLARSGWETYPDDVEVLRLVKEDLTKALTIKSDYLRATLLLAQVNAKIAQLSGPVRPNGNGGGDGQRAVRDGYLVSEQDINWIRLSEMRLDENVRIKFENDVLQRYIDSMKGSKLDNWDRRGKEERFRRTSPNGQLAEILRNRPEDVELLKDIHILSDPEFMVTFRNRIWPMLERNCAGTSCHGGDKPRGGLKFFMTGKSERVDYTNYVIISGWGKAGRKLVDRQDPDQSLLLQFGLVKQVSQRPHPDGPTIRLFADKRVPLYRQTEAWIRSLRGPLHPNYHLQWKPPFNMKVDTSGTPDIDLGGEK